MAAAKTFVATRSVFQGHTSKKVLTTLDMEFKKSAGKNRNWGDDPKRLKLVEVFVYASMVKALFESGKVRNVISAKRCIKLHLETREKDRKIRIADSSEALVLGEFYEVSITV